MGIPPQRIRKSSPVVDLRGDCPRHGHTIGNLGQIEIRAEALSLRYAIARRANKNRRRGLNHVSHTEP